jgi:hypothetical protein
LARALPIERGEESGGRVDASLRLSVRFSLLRSVSLRHWRCAEGMTQSTEGHEWPVNFDSRGPVTYDRIERSVDVHSPEHVDARWSDDPHDNDRATGWSRSHGVAADSTCASGFVVYSCRFAALTSRTSGERN